MNQVKTGQSVTHISPADTTDYLWTTEGPSVIFKSHVQENEMTQSIKTIGFPLQSCYQANLINAEFSLHAAEA